MGDIGECPAEGSQVREPVERFGRECLTEDGFELGRTSGGQPSQGGSRRGQSLAGNDCGGGPDPGQAAGGSLVKGEREGVLVGGGRRCASLDHFRGEVGNRPEEVVRHGRGERPAEGLRHPKVGQFCNTAFVDEDVLRLDVGMDNTEAMGVGKGVGDLPTEPDDLPFRQAAMG